MFSLRVAESKSQRGFTLIELLVVVAIIGVLSTAVLASLNPARAKARDARRKSDMAQIRAALHLHFDTYGNWVQSGSGCGYNGNGNGWFNYSGGTYPKSIGRCLVEAGFMPAEIKDPTGNTSSTPTARNAYMKYSCAPDRTYVYAKLETLPQNSSATDGTCCPTCDSGYGMNYYVQI